VADSRRGTKSPDKTPPRTSPASKTEKLAKQLALEVIREHGLPKEIKEQLLSAGVDPEIIERIGGHHFDHPHGAYGYKRKKT
jgi:hypothetical protein